MVAQIQPTLPENASAFDRAAATCHFWGVKDFGAEMVEHLRRGFVFSLPHLFLMMMPVEMEGRRAWLVTHAIGNLNDLAAIVPFQLPWFVFKRRFDRRLRWYPAERMLHLARRPKALPPVSPP